jgi:signal transduction histidine kinase
VTTLAARVPAAFARLSRQRDGRLVAGVCAGLARTARVDPTFVRLLFALFALAGGAGIVGYAGGWLALPEDSGQEVTRRRRLTGILLLLIALTLALRAVGIADSVLWPALIVAVGAYLLQRRDPEARRARRRKVFGLLLVIGGAVAFVSTAWQTGSGSSLIAPTGLLVALGLVVGPWIWRLAQERDAERLARIRAQERADIAARVHDSVLQTLALVQRSADDPKRVAALARRQERELRGWLYGEAATAGETLRGALEAAISEVEETHAVRADIVQSGDAPLDDRVRSLVLAAREAVANAASHAQVAEVSVFVEVGEAEVSVYVRDRGTGFDPSAVPADRRGIAESIVGRLSRSGGSATVRSAPGEGTEVELRLPLEGSR